MNNTPKQYNNTTYNFDDNTINAEYYQNYPGFLYMFYDKLKPMFGPHYDESAFEILVYNDD